MSDVKIRNAKAELKDKMINGILEYVTHGTFPNNSPNSYMNAYTLVNKLADDGDTESEALFKFHNEVIKKFVVECREALLEVPQSQLVNQFIKKSENINFLVYWMNRIFTYLDRFYTKSKGKRTLCKNALEIIRTELVDKLENNLHTQVNILIKGDRNGQIESRPKIKYILKVIDDVELFSPKIIKENNKILWVSEAGTESKNGRQYSGKWYATFDTETNSFAKKKAEKDILSMSAPEYIVAALKYLEEEYTRESEYINKNYHNKINEINYRFFVKENANKLKEMDTGIPYMFKTKRNEELAKAYTLISKHPESLEVITSSFDPYIRKRGGEIFDNKEISKDPRKFIPELINLKKEMDDLVAVCFGANTQFQDTKNKSFSKFMGKEHYAKQLSNYTDFCMRSGFKGKSDEQIENELDEIIGLFKCISNKLTFQVEANKKMSDRLIQKKTLSMNAEKKLISKLKQEAGKTYVEAMSKMMEDLDKNRTEAENYAKTRSQGKPGGIKFNVQVVSQSAWEINKKHMEKINLPKFLDHCIKDFEDYYLARHNGHKLIWCLGLSKIDIKYLTLNKQYISTSTLIQFLTLLSLEKLGSAKLDDIANELGVNVKTVINDISGLIFNQSFNKKADETKGLIKAYFINKEFKPDTLIEFNTGFTNNIIKFNTMPLNPKKTAQEEKNIEIEESQITKKYQENILQACITRIMKGRIGQKTNHVWLIGETSKQVDLFSAQPQQIKEAIEKLIEKNIIKRGEKDRSCYEYIA